MQKKIFFSSLLIIMFSIIVNAQTDIEIQWQKCFGGSSYDSLVCIQQTTDGGYILAGSTYSNNGDVSGNNGWEDAWVVKLDELGDIEWQKCLGGSYMEEASYIQQTSDGGYILAGYTDSNDGDVTENHGNSDAWVVKLDESGEIEWQKCLGGSNWDYASSVQLANDEGYIIVGYTYSNDGDVTGNHGNSDAWVVKLDESGDIEWQKCLGGSYMEAGLSIRQTSDGGYIFSGYTNSNDGDVLGNNGWRDAWVVKLDGLGDIEWQKCLGGSYNEEAIYIQQTSDGGYILVGYTGSNDGDVTGNHGNYDAWVVKIIDANITGFVFHDENQNDLFDETEQVAIGHLIKLEPGPSYCFTNNEGRYYFKADEGDCTVRYLPLKYWFATTDSILQFTIEQTNVLIDNLDFGIASEINTLDVAVYITGSSPRIGSGTSYWINYKNWGDVTSSGTINIEYDSDLTFITSEETPNSHVENLISWNYDPIAPGVQRTFRLVFLVPGIEHLGDTLCSNVWITPFVSDSCTINNIDRIYQEITAAFDPNDKTVSPIGYFEEGYVLHGQRLNYTIRFQNTGNDTAFTVIIKDTLDLTNMDIETFNVETYSHPVTWQLKNTNVMEFKFSNILLPDSTTNEPESHGFVRFSISPKSGLADYSVVNNTAYIYFDYNPPIATNTTKNTYVTNIPGLVKVLNSSELIASVYPNPAKDELHLSFTEDGQKIICFTNMLGQNIYQTTTDKNKLTIDISEFERGMCFINVKCNHKSSYAKIVKD